MICFECIICFPVTISINLIVLLKSFPKSIFFYKMYLHFRFTDVVANWPSSQHDAGIFERSQLKTHLEERDCGWLLCDSGYPLKKDLITPKTNANRQEEISFNLAHSQTRMVVERVFGVLKSKFWYVKLSLELKLMDMTLNKKN